MRASGDRWRLGHRPSLDGLRGVAVLAVFAYHGVVLATGEAAAFPALGVVGVGIFFTLSGFLITSLLLDDREQSGRIRFGRFWGRRARRLLPAVVTLVIIELLVSLFVPGFVHPASAAATLLYVQNWFTGVGGGSLDGLQHTWSLAIEEQFYLVWPFVVAALARFGWRVLAGVALLGAAASCVWREVLWGQVDAWRIYAGTDTKADGLLIGCALAVAIRQMRQERSRTAFVLAGLVVLALTTQMTDHDYHVIAPLLTALATAAILFGASQGQGFRPFEVRWLRWMGQRSYGLYLWHIPVLELVERSGVNMAYGLPMYVCGSLALTVLSWRFIEQPWLRRGALSRTQVLHPHLQRVGTGGAEYARAGRTHVAVEAQ
jgi:peptidoglycan/LPS O-acetylase OafA/YrhL